MTGEEATAALIAKGFVPHSISDGEKQELKWERPGSPTLNWPTAAVLIMVLIFVLILIKGWPA